MSFRNISIRELPTWVKVLQREPDAIIDKLELLAELNLIDDLLTLQKSQSLLNKKRNLKAQLEARIGLELGHNVPNLNARIREKT